MHGIARIAVRSIASSLDSLNAQGGSTGNSVSSFSARSAPVIVTSSKLQLGALCAGAQGGYTPLHYAARQGRLAMVRLLIERGATLL